MTGPVYLRFGDDDGDLVLTGRPPVTHDTYLHLCQTLIDLEAVLVDPDELARGVTT